MSEIKINSKRLKINEFLNFSIPDLKLPFTTKKIVKENGYTRIRINYTGDEGDQIHAFLLLPQGKGPFGAVLIHHQHNGQRHFGKSEICGLVGDPLQAFGPILVKRNIAVLAPDSICFEDRRRNCYGTEPNENDVNQHYDEMCHRLVRSDTLMRKVLDDSARGITLLQEHPLIDSNRIGIMGHSYGGNTVLFHAGLDERIKFACSSGAACSYEYKINNQVGIEMAEVIPGFSSLFDIQDMVSCIAPRPMLLVSATEDKYSMDADMIFQNAREIYISLGFKERLEHKRYEGEHAITQDRFNKIVEWLSCCVEN